MTVSFQVRITNAPYAVVLSLDEAYELREALIRWLPPKPAAPAKVKKP